MKQFLTIAVVLLLWASIAKAQEAVSTTATPKPLTSPSASSEVERVVVSGGEIESSETDKAQSVTILSEDNLKLHTEATLGDTLATQPGVAASGYTAGASRPVIHGQADNRVRVLNNGTELFDVSNLSPDHGPSVSTLLSQSIEVVHGPATILYGSGAIGGVVNVTDNLIPVEQPATTLSGEVDCAVRQCRFGTQRGDGAHAFAVSALRRSRRRLAFAHRRPRHSRLRFGSTDSGRAHPRAAA